MAPTIILVRHAQALHNVDNNLHDPELSELGRQQCQQLRENLVPRIPRDFDVGLIIVSPMKRTIETAMLAFPELIERGIPIVAHAGWQENSSQPCDTGTPLPLLTPLFPLVSFTTTDPLFPDKTSPATSAYSYLRSAIVARGKSALDDLRNRPEKAIIVVSHSGFLRAGVTGRWFMNADYRVFDFVGGDDEGEDDGAGVGLRQWEGMERGGMGWSFEKRVPLGDGLPDADGVVRDGKGPDGDGGL